MFCQILGELVFNGLSSDQAPKYLTEQEMLFNTRSLQE